MCHVFERFLMHCFEISRWLFRWFFFENSTGNRRAKVLNLLIFGSGDCGEVCRWMRCSELQLLLGYYSPFGECKLIVGLLSCSITPSYHQNVVSPITHACRDGQLVFPCSVADYALVCLTTALHWMQNGAVAASISSGPTGAMFIVLSLPHASLPASSSWRTCTVPVSLCATKLYSSGCSRGTAGLSPRWILEWMEATSVSSKSDSSESSSPPPWSSKFRILLSLFALLASGSRRPSITISKTFETLACNRSWESLL